MLVVMPNEKHSNTSRSNKMRWENPAVYNLTRFIYFVHWGCIVPMRFLFLFVSACFNLDLFWIPNCFWQALGLLDWQQAEIMRKMSRHVREMLTYSLPWLIITNPRCWHAAHFLESWALLLCNLGLSPCAVVCVMIWCLWSGLHPCS